MKLVSRAEAKERIVTKMRFCKLPLCNTKHHANGFCEKHNRQYKRTGNPYKKEKTPQTKCSRCDNERASFIKNKRLCYTCYKADIKKNYLKLRHSDKWKDILAYQRAYRKANPEKFKAFDRKYYLDHREYYLAYAKRKRKEVIWNGE